MTLGSGLECAIQPRNYHARRKTTATQRPLDSRPPNTYATHQPSEATQSIPPSSQQPPATAALATETSLHTNITKKQVGWWTRFLLWIGVYPAHGESTSRETDDGFHA
ncbi:hypothetical protein F4604DRAFT_1684668 [Suillus subluteus]|nr:hypothetical protein F4604DRAFT_1684668 [Suillus subluteus]